MAKLGKLYNNYRCVQKSSNTEFVQEFSEYLETLFDVEFVFGDSKNSLVTIFIQIRQLIGFFKIVSHHMESCILNFSYCYVPR